MKTVEGALLNSEYQGAKRIRIDLTFTTDRDGPLYYAIAKILDGVSPRNRATRLKGFIATCILHPAIESSDEKVKRISPTRDTSVPKGTTRPDSSFVEPSLTYTEKMKALDEEDFDFTF